MGGAPALLFVSCVAGDGATDTSPTSVTDGVEDSAQGCDASERVTVYADRDGDGFGDPATAQATCTPADQTTTGKDCDDSDAAVSPIGFEVCGDGVDQDCSGDDPPCIRSAVLPTAPTADRFQWQAVQTTFVDASGAPCEVPVAVAMGDQVACYVDGGSDLWCAGRLYVETYGTSFVPTGLTGVSQVLLMPTVDGARGNGACAVVAGEPTCLGFDNPFGQLGNGTNQTTEQWTPWVSGTDIRWLATGTNDAFCGPDSTGAVWCAGYGIGSTPGIVTTTSGPSVWLDTSGNLQTDDPTVLRVSQGRSACGIRPGGLDCGSDLLGRAGHLVDGGQIQPPDPSFGDTVVWLEDDGTVHLLWVDTSGVHSATRFRELPVLAIAYHYYTDSVCAVYTDGSLACFGSNEQGKLGTGGLARLGADTVVLPPGTFDLACR